VPGHHDIPLALRDESRVPTGYSTVKLNTESAVPTSRNT